MDCLFAVLSDILSVLESELLGLVFKIFDVSDSRLPAQLSQFKKLAKISWARKEKPLSHLYPI